MKPRARDPLVRLPVVAYRSLKAMSKETGRKMSDLVADAIDRYRREQFLEAANREYAAMTPAQRRSHREEIAIWEGTLLDGLEDEDWEEERRAQERREAAPRRRVVVRPRPRPRP